MQPDVTFVRPRQLSLAMPWLVDAAARSAAKAQRAAFFKMLRVADVLTPVDAASATKAWQREVHGRALRRIEEGAEAICERHAGRLPDGCSRGAAHLQMASLALAAQRVLEASWAEAENRPSDGGVVNLGDQGDLYERSKPPPPPPDDNRRETMDQKLRRMSYEKEQAALHLQHAREQRAKFMKRGGRPTAADYAEWNPNAKVKAVDENSLAAVQAAHDAWVKECEREDSGHAPDAPSSEEIAKAAALAVRGRRASQGGASRSLWVAPDVLS